MQTTDAESQDPTAAGTPTPVRCPVLAFPDAEPVDPAELDPLLARLADPAPVNATEAFPRGTLQPDGRLDLCKQGLGAAGAARVLPVAVASPHARHLLLGTNTLGAEGVAALAGALAGDHRLHTLYLGCNHIDAAGVRPLLDRLAGDGTVRALWLKRNPIGDDGARAVAAALRRNTAIRTLDLTNTGMSLDGLTVLADALVARGVAVERLYLGGNGFGPAAAPVLAGLLRDAGVGELYLAASNLGDDGVRVLATGLAAGAAVPAAGRIVLGLGGNGLGLDGVRALAGRLPALAALDLSRPPSERVLRAVPNRVGDDGAAELAAALPGSGLRRLDLRNTGVRGRGAKALLGAVERGTALEQLGLGSGIPRRIKREVGARLLPVTVPPLDVRAIGSVYR